MNSLSPIQKSVCAYVRVSTTRQAEADLSLPDQQGAIERYCLAHNLQLAEVFVEPGASATDDNRPELQRMIDRATSPERPYSAVIIHSFSRFFRDLYLFELYRRRLEKAGVQLISITQAVSDDSMGDMARKILATFDEYQSKEARKHTMRTMKANAVAGFFNGSKPPFGYTTYEAERRGTKSKKKLMLEPSEAELVTLAFDLYLSGNGKSGPIGIAAIAMELNKRGHQLRGKMFQKSTVHAILTRETYTGVHFFNQRGAKGAPQKSRDEWVKMDVPVIIDRDQFDSVQIKLNAHRQSKTPSRVTNGPTLLVGLLRCAGCDCSEAAGMTLRTGKSGRYRYYTCSRKIRFGAGGVFGPKYPG